MTYKLYYGDLIDEDSLRQWGEETSDQTIALWAQSEDPYEIEQLDSKVNGEARRQYFALTGERIIFRSKLLGLPVNAGFLEDQEVLSSRPFVDADCTVSDLLAPSVQVAMAYVPLTPDVNDETSQPVLARLYCVRGLNGKHPIPFDSAVPVGAEGYSWFLAGCKKNPKPKHESWHLAAHLLMRVVEDVHRKKNLATHFVVTGRVQSGEIKPVEMGRKSELADIWEFKDLKWIMHEDNKVNMNNAMRKVETPKTLEEALELIGTLQNKATSSFFKFLRNGDLAGAKEQFEIGADIFACEKSTGQMPMEILGELIEKEAKKPSDNEQKSHSNGKTRLLRLKEMMTWLKAQGADCALMFYMLAKYGLDEALKSCLKIWPIDARTASGLNATELALESGDYDVALKLCALGCKCRSKARNTFLAARASFQRNAGLFAIAREGCLSGLQRGS